MSSRGMIYVLALLVPVSSSGCAVFFPGHPNSEAKKSELIELVIYERAEADPSKRLAPLAAPVVAALIPIAIGFAVDRFNAALEAEAERYSAGYSVSTAREMYLQPPAANGYAEVKLKGFKLVRYVNGKAVMALSFTVHPSMAMDAFRVSLDEVRIAKSKAKVFDARWKSRWWSRLLVYGLFYDLLNLLGVIDTGDGSVDVNVAVKMSSLWIDSKNVTKRSETVDFQTTVNDLSLDGGEATDDCQIHTTAYETKNGTCPAYVRSYREEPGKPVLLKRSGWLPAVPVSFKSNKAIGRGNYDLTVSVIESDDFGEFVSKAAQKSRKHQDKVVEKIVEIVQPKEEQ